MEELTLFQMEKENTDSLQLPHTTNIEVAKMKFIGSDTLSWQDLFSGYDTLYAITYSSGLHFVYQLLHLFDHAEIIFGCDEVISYSLQEIMAYQSKLIDRIRETAGKQKLDLISRIEEKTLRFYVARTVLSHEKIYLLSSKEGEKRVVMGSANLSFPAFNGKQRENICYLDGEEAYNWYLERYQQLRDESTDEIAKEALLYADQDTNLGELPIFQTVKVKKALVLQPVEEVKDDIRFILDVKNLAKRFSSSTIKPGRQGKILLSPEQVKTICRRVAATREKEKEFQNEYPQLEIFPDDQSAKLNGNVLDLFPPEKEIKKDVTFFLKYMDGYQKFHGDVTSMQRRYFEFANWFFCSPFMAPMRDMATRYNQNLLPYPVYGLVYGQSKAGKTSFLETLLKMMIGQKIKISAPDFTRSNMEMLKHTVRGAPIIVDDLINNRFKQHAIEIIKNDDFGISEHLLHYPAIVISANEDIKAVAPEVVRRTVICRVQAGLTNTEVMKSNIVRTVQREVGTAFYREYLRRMLKILPELLEEIKDENSEGAPDILAISSQMILEILTQYADQPLPDYVRTLTLDDYFSEKVIGSYAIKTIRKAWQTSRSSFEILERSNELRYNAGATYEADRILQELPETLEPRKSRDWVILNLDAAKTFFDIPFKKSWLSRFQKK